MVVMGQWLVYIILAMIFPTVIILSFHSSMKIKNTKMMIGQQCISANT